MRQIWIPRPGRPEVLEVRETRDPLPGRGQVRIRVAASGVNFADILLRMGMYPDAPRMPLVPGYEVAGIVDAAGEEAETDWIGRDVLALCRFGGYSDAACVHESQVFALPAGMSAEEGAAFPVNYLTAFQLLEVMGSLREGDRVLIHSAAGGVGVAATQLAGRIGARVIGTASAEKHDFLKSMGVEHCIDSRGEDFESRVRELTDGRGVELAIDAVGGRSFRKSFRTLAPSGRLGMYGMSVAAGGKQRSRLAQLRAALTSRLRSGPRALMSSNKGTFGVNLGALWNEMDRVTGWLEVLLEYYGDGAIKPVISARCPFEDAAEAHHYIQDRRNVGKVLLVP